MSNKKNSSAFVTFANMIMAAIIPVAAGFAAFSHVTLV